MEKQTKPIVRINSGRIQGELKQNTFVFKGVPYAEPPTGKLRWHPPNPAPPGEGYGKQENMGRFALKIYCPALRQVLPWKWLGPNRRIASI